jgi:nicotinamidase-related amidase
MTATTGSDLDVQRTALLVMDYQLGIVDMLPDADALLERLSGAIALARSRGMHIGYVRVAFEDSDYATIPATNKSFARLAAGTRMYHVDDPQTAIHERVAPEPGDIIVRKTRVGAFSTTDLDRQLAGLGVTTLILAGISTSGVVLSTVRAAADRDYRLFVLADGCGDPDAEVHDVLTTKVFPRQTDVNTIAEHTGMLAE